MSMGTLAGSDLEVTLDKKLYANQAALLVTILNDKHKATSDS